MENALGRRFFGIRLGVLQQHDPRPFIHQIVKACPQDSIDLPLISLVTPSLNQAKYIGKTVESVLGQQYPSLEYIIQDACSQDGTHEVLRAFPQEAIKVYVEKDQGQADAINRGFLHSHGEIMAWLNSDDLLLPGTLHLVGNFFQRYPGVDVVYGNRIIIDSNSNVIGRWILPGHDANILRFVDYVPQETLFWRRSIWERVGGRIDDTLKFAIDWELLLRFFEAEARFAHLPLLLGAFRVHTEQKTNTLICTYGFDEMRQLRNRYGGSGLSRLILFFQHIFFLVKHKVSDYQFPHNLYCF